MGSTPVESVRGLYTDPVLRRLNMVLGALILGYLGLVLSVSFIGTWFAVLVAVAGPWAVVSAVSFPGLRGGEALPRMQVVLLIAILAGFYAFLISVAVLFDVLGVLPDTRLVRGAVGGGIGLSLAAGLYVWAFRWTEADGEP